MLKNNKGIAETEQQWYCSRAMQEWLTTEEAAKELKVSGSRVRAMAASGLLDVEKRGRDLVVSAGSVRLQKSSYGQLTTAMRIRVYVRDMLTCQKCGFIGGDPGQLHVHHRTPRSQGGTNAIENLETLCCDCHHETHGWGKLNYLSKTYSLDDGVVALMDGLKKAYGSFNKGLRATLIDGAAAPGPCGHAQEIASLQAEVASQAKALEDYEGLIASLSEGEIPDGALIPSEPMNGGGSPRDRQSAGLDALVSSVPEVQMGATGLGTNQNRCRHCGTVWERPAETKPANICTGCMRGGHRQYGECRQCVVDAEVAKRSAESTHSEPGAVDWNPPWET